MRVKRCNQCGGDFTPTSELASLSQSRCPPCWAEYQRELYANPRAVKPCLRCGAPTQDHRASVKYCPAHRFDVREKKCPGCGAMWLPRNWAEFQSRTRCKPCWSAARKPYRHAAYHGLRKPRLCGVCGEPTGDVRQSVKYCPEHSFIGRWWKLWQKHKARTQAEHRARLEELERQKPYMEERKWLAMAKKELRRVKSLLREKNRNPQASTSRPRATSRR